MITESLAQLRTKHHEKWVKNKQGMHPAIVIFWVTLIIVLGFLTKTISSPNPDCNPEWANAGDAC